MSVYLVPETEAQVSFPALRWLQNFKTRLTQHLAPSWPLSTPQDGSVYFVTAPDICNFFTRSIIYCAVAEQEMLQ